MGIFQEGSLNTTALIVPDLYIQIVPPKVTLLNGVSTDILGVVGIATWGPKNSPVTIADMAQYSRTFGPIQTSKYDLGTAIATAIQQGAKNFRAVRVTDGTDVAASMDIKDGATTPATGVTLTSIYTGSYGNKMQAVVGAGAKSGTMRVSIAMPGEVPEVFDNIEGSGATLWAAIVTAINYGQSGLRGPSQLVVATIGTSTAAPAEATYTATGGTDGNTTITGSVLIGTDTTTRTGMYALRNTGASVAFLADCDDSTSYATQVTFGLAEGIYMILVGTAGQAISAAITAKGSNDSYAFKFLMGDWVYWNDTANGQVRLVSPQGFVAGRLANLSPEQSSLNKQIYGIVGTQKSYLNQVYSNAELAQLINAGIDVIASPSPGGKYFSCRVGHNGSSSAVINGDNYTRMTNYIAATLNAGMGVFIGRLQTVSERLEAKNTLVTFLANMEQEEMIGDVNGGAAYQVTLNSTNNPSSRVALGYQVADVKVKYLSIVEKFIINVEGGTSVEITRASTESA